MMRYLTVLLCLALTLAGCSGQSNTPQINKDLETLQEAGFEFQYPKDWKITSTVNASNPDQKETVYNFQHPRNKDMLIAIEIFTFPEGLNSADVNMRKVLSNKVRVYKSYFDKINFENFTFQTSPIRFANYDGLKLVAQGTQGSITAHYTAICIPLINDFHVISYRWFDYWGKPAKSQIEGIVNTFAFTR